MNNAKIQWSIFLAKSTDKMPMILGRAWMITWARPVTGPFISWNAVEGSKHSQVSCSSPQAYLPFLFVCTPNINTGTNSTLRSPQRQKKKIMIDLRRGKHEEENIHVEDEVQRTRQTKINKCHWGPLSMNIILVLRREMILCIYLWSNPSGYQAILSGTHLDQVTSDTIAILPELLQ